MNKRLKSQHRIPSFKGVGSFKPLEPESGEELPDEASDPMLRPEEQGTIKRYLRYADTLINGPETNGPETTSPETSSDETRPTDKDKAA